MIQLDNYHLPLHIDQETGLPDGGDAPANLGRYCYATNNEELFRSSLKCLYNSNGLLIRHPVKWNDPKDFSRDQYIPILACIMKFDMIVKVEHHLDKIKSNYSRCPNGDVFWPWHYQMAYRKWSNLNPLKDSGLYPEVLLRNWITKHDPNNVGDDLNLTLILKVAQDFGDSRISQYCRRLYAKNVNLKRQWNYYYRNDSNLIEIAKVWEPLIEEMK